MARASIPVYLVTGFFGSGKTTLINHVLSTVEKDRRIAVLVNDFGDVDIDSTVMTAGGSGVPQVHSVAGGSIFCSCRHWEFVTGLHALADHGPDFIIVEASGMADPSPIKTDIKIASDLDKEHEYAYAGAICLVDASLFSNQLGLFPVVRRQVKHAAIVVVNKMDLLGEMANSEKDVLVKKIRRINKGARVEFTTNATIDLTILLQASEAGGEQVRPDRSLNEPGNQPGKLVLESRRALPRDAIIRYYDAVKDKILRFKGFCLLEDGWYHVNAVGDQLRFSPIAAHRAKSELVCIFVPAGEARLAELRDLWQQFAG
ncbi:MAG: GTP-binding protein [Candidatus Sigynarchaeota archaeon]